MTRVNVITGSFGAGKTTAIRWLMANKPQHELWVVILNEFTDAGIDALSVAQSAVGNYDVRLVAGGCLCCIGELEFGKQLRDILRKLKPDRILVEPSGAGHAAAIVDALGIYETQRALNLDSVICLVDPQDAARILHARAPSEWSQIQSADVLLLSKADIAGPLQQRAFEEIASLQYPAKQFLGTCKNGVLPPQALQSFERMPRFSLIGVAESHAAAESVEFAIAGLKVCETQMQQLGLWAVQWLLPRELVFSRSIIEPRLIWLLQAHGSWLRRMKGVFRTGVGPSWLIQSHGHGLAVEDSAHRRDSRVEIVLSAAPGPDFLNEWRTLWQEAVNQPND